MRGAMLILAMLLAAPAGALQGRSEGSWAEPRAPSLVPVLQLVSSIVIERRTAR